MFNFLDAPYVSPFLITDSRATLSRSSKSFLISLLSLKISPYLRYCATKLAVPKDDDDDDSYRKNHNNQYITHSRSELKKNSTIKNLSTPNPHISIISTHSGNQHENKSLLNTLKTRE